MRNAGLIFFILLVSSACLPVQAANPSSESDQAFSKTSDLTTLKGCVSFRRDLYVLTEDDGTFHQLAGSDKKFGQQVGHMVEVTGKPGTITVDRTLAGGASTVVQEGVFKVKTLKPLPDTCK